MDRWMEGWTEGQTMDLQIHKDVDGWIYSRRDRRMIE